MTEKALAKDALETSPSGLLLVDKSGGMTSHDVVARARRLAKTRRVGHAGTLDPAATGLLILGINTGTKLLQYVTGADKTYLGTIRLGISTNTDDAEGEVLTANGAEGLLPDLVDGALQKFRGPIMQIPTTVSAIKINGRRAYALARAGEKVELQARPVTVNELERTSELRSSSVVLAGGEQQLLVVDFEVRVSCSSGTYIRALARDIGNELGVGGHLTALRRTKIGKWDVADASTLTELSSMVEGGGTLPVISIDAAARQLFPELVITNSAAVRFSHGTAPAPTEVTELREAGRANPKFPSVLAVSAQGEQRILGLVERKAGGTLGFKTVAVLPGNQG